MLAKRHDSRWKGTVCPLAPGIVQIIKVHSSARPLRDPVGFAGQPHNAYRVTLYVHTEFGHICESNHDKTPRLGRLPAHLGGQVRHQILKEGSMAVHIGPQLQINQVQAQSELASWRSSKQQRVVMR